MEYRLDTRAQVDALAGPDVVGEKLAYVPAALRLIRTELGDRKAVLGFGGSP